MAWILSFVMTPLGKYALGTFGVLAFLTTVYVTGYNKGYNKAIDRIAAQDQEATSAAAEARKKVLACRNSGGEWNVESGKCSK